MDEEIFEPVVKKVKIGSKDCKSCNTNKDFIYFQKSNNIKDGFSNICKPCLAIVRKNRKEKYDKERLENKVIIVDKKCTLCTNVLPIANFCKDSKIRDGFSVSCRACNVEYKERYKDTRDGFLQCLYIDSKSRIIRKNKDGKKLDHTLTRENVNEILAEQEDMCYYTGVIMTFRRKSDFQCSIERLDNDIGYTKNNTVFCCLEFNNQKQWTSDKIKLHESEIKMITDDLRSEEKLESTNRKYEIVKKINDLMYKECNRCNEWILEGSFSKTKAMCKICQS